MKIDSNGRVMPEDEPDTRRGHGPFATCLGAEAFKRHFAESSLSISELGRRCGVSRQTASKWVKDPSKMSLEYARKAYEAMGRPPELAGWVSDRDGYWSQIEAQKSLLAQELSEIDKLKAEARHVSDVFLGLDGEGRRLLTGIADSLYASHRVQNDGVCVTMNTEQLDKLASVRHLFINAQGVPQDSEEVRNAFAALFAIYQQPATQTDAQDETS